MLSIANSTVGNYRRNVIHSLCSKVNAKKKEVTGISREKSTWYLLQRHADLKEEAFFILMTLSIALKGLICWGIINCFAFIQGFFSFLKLHCGKQY